MKNIVIFLLFLGSIVGTTTHFINVCNFKVQIRVLKMMDAHLELLLYFKALIPLQLLKPTLLHKVEN